MGSQACLETALYPRWLLVAALYRSRGIRARPLPGDASWSPWLQSARQQHMVMLEVITWPLQVRSRMDGHGHLQAQRQHFLSCPAPVNRAGCSRAGCSRRCLSEQQRRGQVYKPLFRRDCRETRPGSQSAPWPRLAQRKETQKGQPVSVLGPMPGAAG